MRKKLFLLFFLFGTLFFFFSPLVNKPIFACDGGCYCTYGVLESCHCHQVGNLKWCHKIENDASCPGGKKLCEWEGLDCFDCGGSTGGIPLPATIRGTVTVQGQSGLAGPDVNRGIPGIPDKAFLEGNAVVDDPAARCWYWDGDWRGCGGSMGGGCWGCKASQCGPEDSCPGDYSPGFGQMCTSDQAIYGPTGPTATWGELVKRGITGTSGITISEDPATNNISTDWFGTGSIRGKNYCSGTICESSYYCLVMSRGPLFSFGENPSKGPIPYGTTHTFRISTAAVTGFWPFSMTLSGGGLAAPVTKDCVNDADLMTCDLTAQVGSGGHDLSIVLTTTPPPGKISGTVYKNTTGLTCNTGSLQSGRTVTIAGTGSSTYSCPSVTTAGDGSYTSDSCSNGKPPIGSSYTVSVSHNATNESCLSCGGASCSQSASLVAAPSVTQNFTIFPVRAAWYQTAYGDVHANTSVNSAIPADTCTSPCSPYLSLGGGTGNNSPGVVSAFGSISPSANMSPSGFNWQVRDNLENLNGFGVNNTSYKYSWFVDNQQNCVPFDKNWNQGQLKKLSGCYIVDVATDQNLNGQIDLDPADLDHPNGHKVILLANGNITVNNQITVPSDGFLAIVASGDIVFGPNVGASSPSVMTGKTIEGVYIADGWIKTLPSPTTTGDKKFIGKGMFIANADFLDPDGDGDTVALSRNLDPSTGGINNASYPSEYFEYRPDFLVNFPVNFGVNKFTWQEVAP